MAARERGEQLRDEAEQFIEQAGFWDRIKLGTGVTALAALVLFLLQNLQSAEINFLWFEWSTRVTYALLLSAGFGGLGAVLVSTFSRRRDR